MFKGVYTALVTPFENGKLDEPSLCDLIEWQIDEGIHGLVIAGTTGEASTLTLAEYQRLLELSIETARSRVPVIAGTGSFSTTKTIETTQLAKDVGAAAALVVAPYYNAPSQEGMRRHYEALTQAVDLPIIIYNVPGRTMVDMDIPTMAALSRLENIVGVKDATNDLARPLAIRRFCSAGFTLLGGGNSTFGAFLAQGGEGGILVTSNVTPKALREMYDAWVVRDITKYTELNNLLFPLHEALFCESNPSPVKYAVSTFGKCRNELRLPLLEATRSTRDAVDAAMGPIIEAGYAPNTRIL